MTVRLSRNLLRLSFGLSVSLFLVKAQAQAFVQSMDPGLGNAPLIGQRFEPTDTRPPNDTTPIATTGGRYQYFQPPADGRRLSGSTTTTGTRGGSGCPNVADNGLVFSGLGPRSTIGLTASVRPTFVWYVAELEAAAPILFRLLVLDEAEQVSEVVDTVELSAQPGFMQYQLPDTLPPLAVGKKYLWQVIVRCPENPSSFLASTLPLQVVAPTPELTEALSTATTDSERATAYGQAGLWYNALALVSAATGTTENDIRTGLLRDLAILEGEDETFSATLTAIADQTAADRAPILAPMTHRMP